MIKELRNSALILIFLFSGYFGISQPNTTEQLAVQYFQNREFDKASELFEKLYNDKKTPFYYNYYLDCFVELKDYEGAEKFLKKTIKKNPLKLSFLVDLGYVFKLKGDGKNSAKAFNEAINKISPDQIQILELADAFIKRNEYDLAIETYKKGRKVTSGYYNFSIELADLYSKKNDFQSMLDEYLYLLDYDLTKLPDIQGRLQDVLSSDADNKKNEIFRSVLMNKIKKDPDKKHYVELLYWYYIQLKEFDAALLQAKSMDKRNGENGERLFSLAKLCLSNGYYDAAVQCFDYIITKKGLDCPYYYQSKVEILNAKYLKIISSYKYTKQDLLSIEQDYQNALLEIGKNNNTVQLIKNLAHIEAFYLNKSEIAINLLEDALKMPGINAEQIAGCKIELADILLLSGEVWEATLYYSQVEKAYKNEPVGHEAKFKNAKLFYYIGEFDFAKGQLDILRAATSKLIANDAMELSLLISDNIAEDSSMTALKLYAKADFLLFQNKDSIALITLDSIGMLAMSHPLFDEVLYKKAEIMIKGFRFNEADTFLQKLIDFYPNDILADNAIFKLAEIKENHFNDKAKAMELYQLLMTNYPGSLYVVEARKRFRALRGDKIN
jgi:tetratricopeptide (TPR) repeat protein